MPNPRLAARYAKSLTDIASEMNLLEPVFHDMILIDQVCKKSREFVAFLRSPVIHADKKEKAFRATFSDNLSDLTERFVSLLFKKGREQHLPEIAVAVIASYRRIKNIREVTLTTVSPLPAELLKKIKDKIHEEIPQEAIELVTETDESLIGGFILESNNNVFDASISRKLKDIKRNFTENKYISKI